MITQEKLKEILHYSPDTGIFLWKISPANNTKSGSIAGSAKGHTYIRIKFNGGRYLAHRLAWLYMHGSWPKKHLDHINHDRLDNRISNLQEATRRENSKNMKLSVANSTGITGVYFIKLSEKWQALVMVNRESINLGLHEDKFEAICARMSANNKYGFHPNHGR